jgi:hypothetical protein
MPLTKIQSLGITDGAIVAADIASGAITAAKLASGVGGKVLQYVTSTNTAQQSTTSTSYVDATNLSVSITPSSTSNKILILFNGTLQNDGNTANSFLTILRGSTILATTNDYFILNSAGTRIISGTGAHYIDSPNTTSSTTYKIQIRVESGSTGTIFMNSRITVLEIAG